MTVIMNLYPIPTEETNYLFMQLGLMVTEANLYTVTEPIVRAPLGDIDTH